jgi:hypothetical protein
MKAMKEKRVCWACRKPLYNDLDSRGEHHGIVCMNPECVLYDTLQVVPRECKPGTAKAFDRLYVLRAAYEWRVAREMDKTGTEAVLAEIERLEACDRP